MLQTMNFDLHSWQKYVLQVFSLLKNMVDLMFFFTQALFRLEKITSNPNEQC